MAIEIIIVLNILILTSLWIDKIEIISGQITNAALRPQFTTLVASKVKKCPKYWANSSSQAKEDIVKTVIPIFSFINVRMNAIMVNIQIIGIENSFIVIPQAITVADKENPTKMVESIFELVVSFKLPLTI